MKKRKVKIIVLAVAASAIIAALTFGMTLSYLTDREAADNIITIGKVSVKIDEGEYSDPSDPIQAGTNLPKAPKLINDGINDEYVFIRVAIPKDTVTLLYDKDVYNNDETPVLIYKEGTKVAGISGKTELFRTIAKGANTAPVTQSTVNSENNYSPAIDVNYNKHEDNKEGWVYLNTSPVEKQIDGVDYQCYYFGYNKRLAAVTGDAPKNETINLFDSIQLKSFIDEEVMTGTGTDRADGTYIVKIDAYAVQADELGIDGLPAGDGILTDAKVSEIFSIIQRKQGAQL